MSWHFRFVPFIPYAWIVSGQLDLILVCGPTVPLRYAISSKLLLIWSFPSRASLVPFFWLPVHDPELLLFFSHLNLNLNFFFCPNCVLLFRYFGHQPFVISHGDSPTPLGQRSPTDNSLPPPCNSYLGFPETVSTDLVQVHARLLWGRDRAFEYYQWRGSELFTPLVQANPQWHSLTWGTLDRIRYSSCTVAVQ